MEFTRDIIEALGAPFPEDEIEFLPRAHSNGKALGLPYIDARSVMRRLDAAVGPGNWSFDFDLLSPDGKMVRGKLTVLGVTKCDAGEAATEDEILKSAVSDALKRCAVHFGIGRYLYYLPRVWAPYDAQRRQFSEAPRLSPAAVDKALAICGISPASRPAAEPPRTMTARTTNHQVRETPADAARKSIWTSGGAPATPEAPAAREAQVTSPPESSGDRAASRQEPRRPEPSREDTAGTTVCSREGCGKPLTRGQYEISTRLFGQPLCLACQKERPRSAG